MFREETMKFVHAADLHVDSPLRGLERYEGAPVERLRRATRDAAENVVSLALDEEVDFLVIAGDLFDGKWRDMQTGLWMAGQFRRLERAGIPVYLLRGNHDAASEVPQRIDWPSNVHEFSVDEPETFLLEEQRVALHGQGFSRREVTTDLAATYPDPVPGHFNIGVLHTSLTGDPQHDTYAATTEEVLTLRGYDYWALGHVHARRRVREEPFIGFSGNTQGRHVNERGPKGCHLVSVEGRSVSVEFRPTDVLRWDLVEIELAPESDVDDLLDRVRARLSQLKHEADGRFIATRIVLNGRCACHSQLVDQAGQEEAVTAIRNVANELDDVWVERIVFSTSAVVDVDRLRDGSDLVGELLRDVHLWTLAEDERLAELTAAFAPLKSKAVTELEAAGVNLDDPERIREWLAQAEGILSTLLVEHAE